MKHYRILLAAISVTLLAFTACDDPFHPEEDFRMNKEHVIASPDYSEGLLAYVYLQMPYRTLRFDEVATDDAVSNDPSNSFRKMAAGGWSATASAQNFWVSCNRSIMCVNNFLSVIDEVQWKQSEPALNEAFKQKFRGEAYALRGILKYYLIRNHGGKGTDGNLWGIPIYNTFVTDAGEFSQPRKSFEESVASANEDFDKAIAALPLDYVDESAVPEKFAGLGLTADQYNRCFGAQFTQRISARIVMAFKARLALLAASPAFNESDSNALWETAANANAEVLKDLGGLDYLDPQGWQYWLKAQITDADLSQGDKKDTKEMIWRRELQDMRDWEVDNYPPTDFGHGRINPTQNFVDAFPMKNGYPITEPLAKYNPSNPYSGRDARLARMVVYDGSSQRNYIEIFDGTTDDAIDKTQYSTRTGYYLRKHLRNDVVAEPSMLNTQKHVIPLIRATEIFLNYAEAANEAWGPDEKGEAGYSARDVIAAIRKRAAINQPDRYLASITTKEDMRKIIRNERRIELSFEGFRFWDIRRWNDVDAMTEPAMGLRLAEDGSLEKFKVEDRDFKPFMIYGPIPFNEVLKFGFIQNQGW